MKKNKHYEVKNRIVLLFTLLMLQSGSFSCQQDNNSNKTYHPPFNDYKNWMTKLVRDYDINGAAVIVFDNNKIIWSDVYGYLNDQEDKKVTSETIFNIQSMSKTVTTTAALLAVQKGLIDLDKLITEYIPEFKVNSCFENNPQNKITMRNLLSCTAGFTHEAPIGYEIYDY